MKIEEGKFYRTRDGQKIGPMQSNWCDDRCWPFVCRPAHDRMYWRRDGEACAGNVNNMRPDLDLVAEWTESPVRTVTRKEIVFGVFGKVMVNEGPTKGTFNSVSMAPTKDPDELRAAAATLTEIAEALSQRTEEAGE